MTYLEIYLDNHEHPIRRRSAMWPILRSNSTSKQRKAWGMEGGASLALPLIGIAAAAAVAFYAVSFMEIREKSFRDLDEAEEKGSGSGGGFRSSASSRERRARRKAEKEARK